VNVRFEGCCCNPSSCIRALAGECVVFGNIATAQPARFHGADRPATEHILPAVSPGATTIRKLGRIEHAFDSDLLGSVRADELALRVLPAERKVGLFERLIAGPQGDPSLREDFLSFLGCLACGTGLAFLLVGIVMFFRTVAP
jgi:hypothetical protein